MRPQHVKEDREKEEESVAVTAFSKRTRGRLPRLCFTFTNPRSCMWIEKGSLAQCHPQHPEDLGSFVADGLIHASELAKSP